VDLLPLFDSALSSLRPPPRLLLAVSGGPDSMALLDLACRSLAERPRRKAFLAVGHVDHGLRGRASAADAAFVRREARRRGLPVRVERAPVKAWAARHKAGLEEAARVLRYQALGGMARAWRCGAVLTAHILDDQAETVLMNLIRGTGPAGLGGMAPDAPWPAPTPGPGPRLLRPLLETRRPEILSYMKDRKLSFRVDVTNDTPAFFRNRVRPVLKDWERERPGLYERIGRLAALVRDEEAFWDARLGPPVHRLDLGRFKRYHIILQRRILRRNFGFASFPTVERARAFALDPGPAPRQSVPGGWLEKRRGFLLFRPLAKGPL
jgi:tRNA(Ile)-lysidine synthase